MSRALGAVEGFHQFIGIKKPMPWSPSGDDLLTAGDIRRLELDNA